MGFIAFFRLKNDKKYLQTLDISGFAGIYYRG